MLVIVWAVVVIGAAGVLAALGRSVWRKASALRAALVALPTPEVPAADPARRAT